MSRLLLVLFCMGYCSVVSSQSYLYLNKLGGKLAIKYEVGDQIRFQLKADPYFTIGEIEALGKDYFVVHETEVKLEDVYRYDIRKRHKGNFKYGASSSTLFFASGILPLAELANQQVSGSGDNNGIHRSIWIASGLLVVGGVVLKLVEPKYFKPGFNKKATVIQQ